jgi:hypothetical protein
MRTWSLHPSMLLESNNYVACWSETLQGIGALLGKHKMHLNHPQLNRFKQLNDKCLVGLNTYLYWFYLDSLKRKKKSGEPFTFDIHKIDHRLVDLDFKMKVSRKQLLFELELLNSKRVAKEIYSYKESDIVIHPIFEVVDNYEDKIEKGDRI